jgi:adenylyl- and sulfurtransferase ThiI
MNENASVVVFPSIFAKSRQSLLMQNIKKILKLQNQHYSKITKDGELVVIDAGDPVFASSAINLLFGISRVCIAKRVDGKYGDVVSAIAKVGANLLLRGEQFHVKVEGCPSGYAPKDVEIAATSALIEKTADSGCRPGTEEKHDKQIYCFLTKNNGYVAIFSDEGHGGVPYNSHGQKIVCCIYDELSAVACIEAIKQGFDVHVLVCYNDANLHDLVKMVNRIIPRIVSNSVTLEFYEIPRKDARTIQQKAETAIGLSCICAHRLKIPSVGIGLSPLVYPAWLVDGSVEFVIKNRLTPRILLAGIDDGIIKTAKEIGLGKYLRGIEKLAGSKFQKGQGIKAARLKQKAHQVVTVKAGPNNIHEILDALEH